jgi:PQQ-like domain
MPIASKGRLRLCGAVALASVVIAVALPAKAQNVLTYHGRADRSGNFVMPALTWERAGNIRQDTAFNARFAGNLYAQPLYWKPSGAASGRLIVASESNTVAAVDAATGNTVWTRSLGPSVPLSALPCGNIDPLGITGTPVIDEASGAIYLYVVVSEAGVHHRVYALSLNDGSVLPGWPIDVADSLRTLGQNFDPRTQNQRGALTFLGRTLHIPFGGHFGDCGTYYGWVLGIPLDNPHRISAWRTRGRGGGIWAPGGIASDGQSLYVTTGNTEGASEWADGEAVFRLMPDLRHSEAKTDFFAASDWRTLDSRDADLGGTNPLPFDLPSGSGTQPVVLALGKDEKAYLLDRRNLGGIGGSLVAERVATFPIRTAPAAFPADNGVFVAFQGRGAHCPGGQRGDLTVLKIASGTSPTINTAWCGAMAGGGAPIVTTTDGHANPIVWILGAEGDNRLHGFRGDTGEALFSSAPLAGLRHFQTLIAADNRLYVGADGRLFAFELP